MVVLFISSSCFKLPAEFQFGELNEQHAEQMVRDRNFGCPELNLLFYRYILKHYPSSAIFQQRSTRPVAYITYRPEGCLGLGYTDPAHRGYGFFKMLICQMLVKLRKLGLTQTYGYAAADNYPSIKGMLAAGGVIIDNYQPDFIEFIPKDWLVDKCLQRYQPTLKL